MSSSKFYGPGAWAKFLLAQGEKISDQRPLVSKDVCAIASQFFVVTYMLSNKDKF